MLKIKLLFKKNKNGWITREFFRLRAWKFQGIIFTWTWIYREIFKSALVYLWMNSLSCRFNVAEQTIFGFLGEFIVSDD